MASAEAGVAEAGVAETDVAAAEACLHPRTARLNGQTHCRECGEAIVSFCKEDTRFFEDASASVSTDFKAPKSIRKELDLLPLSEEVKDLADKIYAEKVGNNTYRSNVRQEVKFNCLFEAFKQLGIYKDPCEIATMLKIKRKGMSRGILRCSFLCTGKESARTATITAVHLVPEMLTRNNIEYDDSHIEDISRIYEYAKERSELLNRSKPQSIASSLVYFYLRKRDKDRKINKNDISKCCGVSSMTIAKLDSELEEILGDQLWEGGEMTGEAVEE